MEFGGSWRRIFGSARPKNFFVKFFIFLKKALYKSEIMV